jgi:hypothetical protein
LYFRMVIPIVSCRREVMLQILTLVEESVDGIVKSIAPLRCSYCTSESDPRYARLRQSDRHSALSSTPKKASRKDTDDL